MLKTRIVSSLLYSCGRKSQSYSKFHAHRSTQPFSSATNVGSLHSVTSKFLPLAANVVETNEIATLEAVKVIEERQVFHKIDQVLAIEGSRCKYGFARAYVVSKLVPCLLLRFKVRMFVKLMHALYDLTSYLFMLVLESPLLDSSRL